MRTRPPPRAIGFRWILLVLALCAWAIAFLVLSKLKGDPAIPVTLVAATAMVVFIWTNGAFWWLELRFPHIEIAPGQYVSRSEKASGFMRAYSGIFFAIYGLFGLLATVACIRVAGGV